MARAPSYAGPGSGGKLIDGVGHLMLGERPDEINALITDWLQRNPAVDRG